MEISKIKFMSKRTQIIWHGSNTAPEEDKPDEYNLKKVGKVPRSVTQECEKLIPKLRAHADLKPGMYQVLEIKFKANEDSESMATKIQKILEGGKVVIMDLPTLIIADDLIEISSSIKEAIRSWLSPSFDQSALDFEIVDVEFEDEEGSQSEAA